MMQRIRLFLLAFLAAAIVYAGPLCSNCITHTVLANRLGKETSTKVWPRSLSLIRMA